MSATIVDASLVGASGIGVDPVLAGQSPVSWVEGGSHSRLRDWTTGIGDNFVQHNQSKKEMGEHS
jgi:hypothetical protein